MVAKNVAHAYDSAILTAGTIPEFPQYTPTETKISNNISEIYNAIAYQSAYREGYSVGRTFIKRRLVLPYAGDVLGKQIEIYAPNFLQDINQFTAAFVLNPAGKEPDTYAEGQDGDGTFLTMWGRYALSIAFNLKRLSQNDIYSFCKVRLVAVKHPTIANQCRWLILDNSNVFITQDMFGNVYDNQQ